MEIRHYKFDRITLDPEVCFGKPCIRGMRMPVASVLGYLGSGMTVKDILKSYPELEADDIYQALAYVHVEQKIHPATAPGIGSTLSSIAHEAYASA